MFIGTAVPPRTTSRKGCRTHFGTIGQYALTEPEVLRLLGGIRHLEDEALLILTLATGIRREDVVSIELGRVDLEHGKVSYWESKKRRDWTAWIDGEPLRRITQYVRTLPRGSRWLFPSPRLPDRHATGRHAYDVLQRWLHEAGLEERPFHALRSTFIKLAQKRGWSPERVSRQTGDSIRVIQAHYSTPSDDEMRETVRERPIL